MQSLITVSIKIKKEVDRQFINIPFLKENKAKGQKKADKISEIKSKNVFKGKKKEPITFVRICKNLEECDIDKISKIIMDMGRKNPFPDITVNQ